MLFLHLTLFVLGLLASSAILDVGDLPFKGIYSRKIILISYSRVKVGKHQTYLRMLDQFFMQFCAVYKCKLYLFAVLHAQGFPVCGTNWAISKSVFEQ